MEVLFFITIIDTTRIKLNIISPYGNEQFVHPDIYYNPIGWNGYEYWLVATPYPYGIEKCENPCVYVSRDGIIFTDLICNPIVPTPLGEVFNSDPDIILFHDTLFIFYREAKINKFDAISVIYSHNGKEWSSPTKKLVKDYLTLISPSCFTKNNIIYIFFVDAKANPNILVRRKYINNEFLQTCDTFEVINIPNDEDIWHIDILNTGEEALVCLCKINTLGEKTYIAKAKLYDKLCIIDTNNTIKPTNNDWENDAIYRSTFVKNYDYYKIWYSAQNLSKKYALGYTERGDNWVMEKVNFTFYNYPNPFRDNTNFIFCIPEQKISFVIYDLLGRRIKTITQNELFTEGKTTIQWNTNEIPAGIYFFNIKCENSIIKGKLIKNY